MVENVFHLGDRTAASLMTPRPDVVFLDARDAKERLHEVLAAHRFSRYPLRGPESDDVVGIVRAKDVLLDVLEGDEVDLANLARPPLFVPETTSAMKTLEQMKASRVHCALVVDEFGVTVGMVTYHDVLEALVGDLPSADRPADALAVRRDDGSWLVDGALPVEEFIELLDLGSRGGQVRGPYHTMGGFVAARLGALPKVADRFTLEDLVVEVVDMDGNRVDKVLVTPAATQSTRPSAPL
jgi:putative hemolysin